ncbi:hypothetical protein ACH5AN_36240 [Streptomyces rochei]|uniref:hypothetical protein n=1 Tax=Streptomyces rochei TaxID=1928 RepID=UPI0037DA34AC
MEKEINENKKIINLLALINFLLLIFSYLGIIILLLTSNNPKLNDIIVIAIGLLFGSAYKELWKSAIASRIQKLKSNELIKSANRFKNGFSACVNFLQIVLLSIYVGKFLLEVSDKINSGIIWFTSIILVLLFLVNLIHMFFSFDDKE